MIDKVSYVKQRLEVLTQPVLSDMYILTNYRSAAQRSAGFSLIELLITIAISAIILGIAAPSFNELMARSRMTDASRDLADRLAVAMTVSESRPTTICVSSDGKNCTATANWDSGYIVFTDAGTVGVVDGTDAILERALPVTGGVSVKSSMELGGTAFTTGQIHFVERAPEAGGALRFTVCQAAREPRLIVVNRIGSMRQSKGTTACA